jgi:hypothetical protein
MAETGLARLATSRGVRLRVEPELVTDPRKGTAPLASYWESEILQVMFWLQAEGIADEADAPLLERFLGIDARVDVRHLDRLLDEGYVERAGDRYRLSEAGAREGGLQFAASFDELVVPVRRECRWDAWCQTPCAEARFFETNGREPPCRSQSMAGSAARDPSA